MRQAPERAGLCSKHRFESRPAKRVDIAATEKREQEIAEDIWEIPERIAFSNEYVETGMKKSVMEPFFSDERWQKEGRKVSGGIVANTKPDYTGQWMVYEGNGKDVRKGDWTSWKLLGM
ncbi:MAG TPA: hypothetical protein VJH63_01895 [Candidatus Paceibacterota bacterium]